MFARLRKAGRSLWIPRIAAAVICVTVFCLVALLRWSGGLQSLELKLYDALVTYQRHDTSFSDRIVVIGMTEDDIQSLGYPISDAKMAELVGKILDGNAASVGVDIIRDLPVPESGEGRAALVEKFQDKRVVCVMRLDDGGSFIGAPPELAKKPSQLAFADFPLDIDGRVRRALLFLNDPNGKQARALAVRLATRYLETIDPNLRLARIPGASDEWFRFGNADYRVLRHNDGAYVRADVSGDQILFDFKGAERYPIVPVSSVLDGTVKPKIFDGKVVIIGMAAPLTVKDFFTTARVTEQFGPEVHAVLIEQLIRSAITGRGRVATWPDWAEYTWTLGWTAVGAVIGLFARQPRMFIALLLSVTLVLLAIVYAAFWKDVWLPALPALIGCVAAAGLVAQYLSHHERSERAVLNGLFKRMVAEDVAQTLWDRREELLAEGQLAAKEVRATILFTDLEGFTTITEAMDKACLMAFLNEYMAVMSDVVGQKPDAFVNKYIGDAIMAVFGPPLVRSEADARGDAKNAVEAALEMREKLAANRERWERLCSEGIGRKLATETPGAVPPWAAQVKPPEVRIRMRIGVQSGIVTAGSLGSRQRLEYTVIGDTVNTAARLESFDKDLMPPDLAAQGCRILIGEQTRQLLPPREYRTREVGSIQLKGKERCVIVHGVLDRADGSEHLPIDDTDAENVSTLTSGTR